VNKLSRSVTIEAPSERVFAYVDDIRNLARHMSESRSMPMMGSKLKLEIMTPETTGVGALYRYSGRMMGLTIDFSETVTQYVAGREKAWRTIGEPQLLIIAGYEMRVLVEPISPGSSRLDVAAIEPRATHRKPKRRYKTRVRMPSKLDPHLDTIGEWLD